MQHKTETRYCKADAILPQLILYLVRPLKQDTKNDCSYSLFWATEALVI